MCKDKKWISGTEALKIILKRGWSPGRYCDEIASELALGCECVGKMLADIRIVDGEALVSQDKVEAGMDHFIKAANITGKLASMAGMAISELIPDEYDPHKDGVVKEALRPTAEGE